MSGTEQLKKKNTSFVWSAADESMLIDLWHEKIAELRGERKNSHTFQEMAVKLQEVGLMFAQKWITSPENIDKKKSKLDLQEGHRLHGNISIKLIISWGLLNCKIFKILCVKVQLSYMSTLLNESQDIIELDPVNFNTEQPCSSSWSASNIEDSPQPQTKKRKMDVNAEIIKLGRERNEMQKEINEERKRQMMEMVKRLDTISSQNAAFQNELLSILREKKNF